MEKCYNTGTITGSDRCCGIVGSNSSYGESIINCYNIGEIDSSSDSNTLVGAVCTSEYSSKMTVTNSYHLSSISNPSGMATSKTSSQLKSMVSTLGNAFKADTNNINGGYPILSWQ